MGVVLQSIAGSAGEGKGVGFGMSSTSLNISIRWIIILYLVIFQYIRICIATYLYQTMTDQRIIPMFHT